MTNSFSPLNEEEELVMTNSFHSVHLLSCGHFIWKMQSLTVWQNNSYGNISTWLVIVTNI